MADKSNSSKSKLKRSGITDCGEIRPLEPLTLKDFPASYYYGQDKKTKPQKDKNGGIIPG